MDTASLTNGLERSLAPMQVIPLEELQAEALEAKQDFIKLQVVYFCEANGKEELCVRYSPGPAGNCTRQGSSDNVYQKPTCKILV